MEEFMHENAREFGARAIEGDAALSKERARVNGAAAIAQSGSVFDADGRAGKGREAIENRAQVRACGIPEDAVAARHVKRLS
jgi:hypothetical protein